MILVDPASWSWRGSRWAHLVSDESYEELHRFAAELGVPRRAFQGDHYDVPSEYRARAIELGAVAVTSRELLRRLRAAGLRQRRRIDVATAWIRAVATLGGSTVKATEAAAELERRYGAPERRYHNLAHIEAVLGQAGVLAEDEGLSSEDRAVATLAICAHDVVYERRSGDDERASAAWARDRLAGCGLSDVVIDRVCQAVLATIAHGPADDVSIAVLVDADLAVLGSEMGLYDQYVDAVRGEYPDLDDQAWRSGREAVLARLAGRENLYVTPSGRARWETVARFNISRELRALRARSEPGAPSPTAPGSPHKGPGGATLPSP